MAHCSEQEGAALADVLFGDSNRRAASP